MRKAISAVINLKESRRTDIRYRIGSPRQNPQVPAAPGNGTSPLGSAPSYKSNSPWIYHVQLGWIYPIDDGAGNAWLWTRKTHGWLWTGEGLFRYLLRHRDQQWIYYDHPQKVKNDISTTTT